MNTEKIRHSKKLRFITVLLTAVIIVLMFPKGESLESEIVVNSIWIQDDLIASMSFEILKDHTEYENEKQIAAESVYPIFVKNNNIAREVEDSLDSYSIYLTSIIDDDIFLSDTVQTSTTFLTPDSYQIFKNLRQQEHKLSNQSGKKLSEVFSFSSDIIRRIYRRGVLSKIFDEITKDTIAIRDGKFERTFPKLNYYDLNSLVVYIEHRLNRYFSSDHELNEAAKEYVTYFIKSSLIYSAKLTNDAILETIDKISKNEGIVNENERIVAKHDRITPEIKSKIDSYRIAKGSEIGFWGKFTQNLGKFIHIIIILIPFIIYIYLFRKKIFDDNLKIALIALLIIFVSFTAFLATQLEVNRSVQYLILVPVASMILTIVFDSRIGFYSTVVVALIVGGLRGNDYALVVTNIIAGGLAAYTVRDIKNRNQIFRSFLFILLGYVLGTVAFGLERFDSLQQILISSGFAASNAIISPALTFGLIIFVERFFGITTELTLFELTDFNSPLLKNLANNAPGTFAHSMTIGSMVENAAIAIGASPILARVGAYYHDVGKSVKPEGFVENQLDNENLHEKLDPKESAQIIIDHVKSGIELAKEYKLPQEIIDFIPMHHGTMIVSYFYDKAVEQYGKKNVIMDDFRYPGPKPNTKETALLMLADACESTVRSMSDPDPAKIENVVNNLTKYRVEDGQMDESPLTFDDIRKIKNSYISILLSQHHKRIRYPQQDKLENSSDDESS